MSERDVIARAILDLWPGAAHWEDQYASVQLHKLEEADAILSALSAAGYAVERGWQPIETAPKDGRTVWVWNGEHCQMEWYGSDEWSGWLHSDPLLSDADPDPVQPTHWRPLPAAPQEERNDGR